MKAMASRLAVIKPMGALEGGRDGGQGQAFADAGEQDHDQGEAGGGGKAVEGGVDEVGLVLDVEQGMPSTAQLVVMRGR